MTTASPATRHTTAASVVVVAGIAAVVSFAHMYGVSYSHGEDWRSWLIPVSIDGLVVAASMVLVTRRRAGLAGGWLAWGALGAGVLASLAANVADAQANLTAQLLAGWPALAFAVAFELLLQQRRADRVQPDQSEPASPVRSTPAAPTPPAPVVGGSPRTTSALGPQPLSGPAPLLDLGCPEVLGHPGWVAGPQQHPPGSPQRAGHRGVRLGHQSRVPQDRGDDAR